MNKCLLSAAFVVMSAGALLVATTTGGGDLTLSAVAASVAGGNLRGSRRRLNRLNRSRIYGGTHAPKEYPWMVRFPEHCGGFLIKSDVVLTAAHCVGANMPRDLLIGAWDVTDWQDAGLDWEPEEIAVKKVKVHPNFRNNRENDVALVFLKKESKLETVALARESPEIGDDVHMLGWEGSDLILHQAKFEIREPSVCGAYMSNPENEICAGRPDASQHTCGGDSGGPLWYRKGGKIEVVGLLNRGPYCPNTHDVYASIPFHRDWINQEAGMTGDAPPLLETIQQPEPPSGGDKCEDDMSFAHKGKAKKDCAWVAKKEKKLPKRCSKKQIAAGCPATCGMC